MLIWIQKGREEALELLQNDKEPKISILTYMELLQCAKNKNQHKIIRSFIKEVGIETIELTSFIGQRAAIYVEEYALSHGMRAADALIAATAVENNLILCSANKKHFQHIKELESQWLILRV